MPGQAAAELQADLVRIYGSAMEWNPALTTTPSGRVSLRITIVSAHITGSDSFRSRNIRTRSARPTR